ncbi:MAG TPA: SMP-30/gluconolactonase/LRE family protein [Spirochaetia bacterium]|nr:SMP-30/gluconolactonase/LRE family protein [Spirochaetia bacterium]
MIPRSPSSLPHVAADRGLAHGEGPAWHPQEKRLYWLDSESGSLLCLDPAGRAGATVPEKVRRFAVQADGGFLLFTRDGALKTWRNGVGFTVCPAAPWGSDAAVDTAAGHPSGRVYCFARPAESRDGALFRVDLDGGVEKVSTDAPCSGGLAFSPDGSTACAADAVSREIHALTVDGRTGALSSRSVIARFPQSLGVPRGIALDSKGFLWIALWGGSCVVRLSPAGKEEQRVYFTARLLSGLAFGGEDSRELFVTSSGGDNRRENGPAAGALFSFRPGVKGAAAPASSVGIQQP